jgi:LmbE family N-acetylglucosaminyl deacetylase
MIDRAPRSALVVAAHPDDIELAAGGTVARWARSGTDVHYLLCTSGEAGIPPGVPVQDAVATRESEQRAAAAVLGAREVVFLREADGVLENTLALRRRIVREIRRLQPEVLVTGDPRLWWAFDGYVNHPDHRAASAAAIEAAHPTAGIARLFPEHADEGLSPHRVSALWIACVDAKEANARIDIESTMDAKLRALACHASQSGIVPPEAVLAMARLASGGAGLAEAFRVVVLADNPF